MRKTREAFSAFIAMGRLLSPTLWMFMGTMILANIAAQMIFPLESLYVQELGANVGQVGLFFTVASIAPLIFQVLGGWISDTIGRLQAIAIGSLCGVSAYLFYLFASSWLWLLPASVLTAMAVSFVAPSFQAFIAEESTEETRGRVYGFTSTIYMVVNIIGPLVGGLIAQRVNFKTMYVVAAGLYGTAAVIRILMARHANRTQRAARHAGHSKARSSFKQSFGAVMGLLLGGGVITWIFISDGVRDVAFSLTGRLMPLYLENEIGLTLLRISALQSITAVVAMLFMTPAGALVDKHGERVSIVGGFGLLSVGWAIFLGSSTFWHFILSRVFTGIGWAMIDPGYSSLISKAVPDKLRGLAFGLFSTSLGFISLPAPWIGAWLWENVSPIFPFYVPLVAMALTLPMMWIKFKLPENAKPEPPGLGCEKPALATVAVD